MEPQEVPEDLAPLDLMASLVSPGPRARLGLPETLESQVIPERLEFL